MAASNIRKTVMVILDGWGIGPKDAVNPIYVADPVNIRYFRENFPCCALQASGLAMGLPWAEEGNSEVGHLTIGSGQTVYQNAVRISLAIEDKSFFNNPVLLYVIKKAKEKGSSVVISGMIGTGITHSSFKHLLALIELCSRENVPVKLHLMTDGRDSAPDACLALIRQLPEDRIGSIGGRFYGMDRDNHEDRINQAMKAIRGNGFAFQGTPSDYVKKNYEGGVNDEVIRPVPFSPETLSARDSDSVIFFNFRSDRMRELSRAMKTAFPNSEIASFTEYEPNSGILPAFSIEKITEPLGKVISDAGLMQLRVAESEKSAHVTYFFNAEQEDPFEREFRIIIPSRNIASHDKFPEMMADEITTRVVSAMEEGSYDFILVNFANADMIAHTGNFEATITAIRKLDECLGMIATAALRLNISLIVTADHGNAERLIDPTTGEKDTRHNPNPIPFYLIDSRFGRKKTPAEGEAAEKEVIGSLCDVAPTVLQLMGLKKPNVMTGQSLLPFF